MKTLFAYGSAVLFVLASLSMVVVAEANLECPLSAIPATTWTQDQFFQNEHKPYVWYLNPCQTGDAPNQAKCNNAGYFQEFDTQEKGGACQMSLDKVTNYWSGSATDGYIGLFEDSAAQRKAKITIKCDASVGDLAPAPNTDIVVTSPGDGTFIFEAQLVSSKICGSGPQPPTPEPVPIPTTTPAPPVPPGQTTATPVPFSTPTPPSPPQEEKKGGCGGGCAFLIIIFIGPLVYVLIFVAWNFKNGKRGKELAPHPEFWMSVPGLIKDGCIFFAQKVCGLVDKIRGKGGSGGGGSYNEV